MMQFLETIRVVNGEFQNLSLHQKRIDKTIKYFGYKDINLNTISIPKSFCHGVYKCRIIYDNLIKSIHFQPYVIKQRKKVKIVCCNEINYSFKYLERSLINDLLYSSTSDDIIIIRNNCVTDSSIANLVFEKNNVLYTPNTPLLEGIQREKLIKTAGIKPIRILLSDMIKYDYLHFINAMQPLGSAEPIDIKTLYNSL